MTTPTYETAAQYGLAVTGIASTPFNVAVGGTDFNDVSNWSQYWNYRRTASRYAILRQIVHSRNDVE